MRAIYSYLGIAALLLSFSACKPEENNPEDQDNNGDKDSKVTLAASLDKTKTWKEGDIIYVNDKTYTISSGAGSSEATFENVVKADRYYAAYNIGNSKVENNVLQLTIPQIQKESDPVDPMTASSDAENLQFKSLLGTMRVKVTGEQIVKKISISNETVKLCGTASIDLTSDNQTVNFEKDAQTSIEMSFSSGKTITPQGANFNINLVPGEYSTLRLNFHNTNGEVMTFDVRNSFTIKSGEVTELPAINWENAQKLTELTLSLENDMDGEKSLWTAGSIINVNGEMVYLSAGENTSDGVFSSVIPAEDYYIVAPNSAYAGKKGSYVSSTISPRQQDGKYNEVNPMVAETKTDKATLKYLAGALDVEVIGPRNLSTAELTITSGNSMRYLTGQFNFQLEGGNVKNMEPAADASKKVTLNMNAGSDITDGRVLRFVMSDLNSSSNDVYTLKLTDINGNKHSVELEGDLKIERNQVTRYASVIEWEAGDDTPVDANLSQTGWSNCYMVNDAGSYTFETKTVDGVEVKDIAKVDWLWTSKVNGGSTNELVSDIKYENGVVSFTASANKGNALLAAFNASGEIVWSWHIWMTDRPMEIDLGNAGKGGGYYMMDRNLGATSAEISGGIATYGLIYQWGRKDPFMFSKDNELIVDPETQEETLIPAFSQDDLTVFNTAYSQAKWQAENNTPQTGTVEFATANPMYFLSGSTSMGQSSWLSKEATTSDMKYDPDRSLWRPLEKSIYDPCPAGYRMPMGRCFSTGMPSSSIHPVPDSKTPPYEGYVFKSEAGIEVWLPAQGYRIGSPASNGMTECVGVSAMIWSGELSTAWRGMYYDIDWPMVFGDNDNPWANGMAVRCIKIEQ